MNGKQYDDLKVALLHPKYGSILSASLVLDRPKRGDDKRIQQGSALF
jgi:hypothetical protein